MHEIELIDYLALTSSVCYLSDLPRDHLASMRAVEAIREPERFAPEEWNRAGAYLTRDYRPQHSSTEARCVLLDVLRRRLAEGA